MDAEEAYSRIAAAFDAGRPAHGYLIVGNLRQGALPLAERILGHVFGEEHVADRAHPDIHWLEPESKSRIISVDAMRARIVLPMADTAFSGGWKAGVVVRADRLRAEAANAFLKTLEEPTARTFFLLLTDSPEQLLPTIISRCQRIDLPNARASALDACWYDAALDILSTPALGGVLEKAAATARLEELLGEMMERAEDEVRAACANDGEGPGAEAEKDEIAARIAARYREYATDLVRILEDWFRDLAALCAGGEEVPLKFPRFRGILAARAARLTRAQAFRNVAAAEELAVALFSRNMNAGMALFAFTDAVNFGTEAR